MSSQGAMKDAFRNMDKGMQKDEVRDEPEAKDIPDDIATSNEELVREAAKARQALNERLGGIEGNVEELDHIMADTLRGQKQVAARLESLAEAIKALQAAATKAKPDEVKERFYFLKTEIEVTQIAIDRLQTQLAMPNNFNLTNRDVTEMAKTVQAGVAHIKTCEKELNITKQKLADRYVERWREKQKKAGNKLHQVDDVPDDDTNQREENREPHSPEKSRHQHEGKK